MKAKLGRIVVLTLSFWVCAFQAFAQDAVPDLTAVKLAETGFSDVRMVQCGDYKVFTIQNDAYKLQASGIAEALRIIRENNPGVPCKVIATHYGVPEVTLTYFPSVDRWETTYRLDESWKAVRNEKKLNSSFGHVDINVYPQLALKNLIITQVYQTLWQLSPSVDVSLWPGGKLSGMVKIPVYNDGYGEYESKVHPGQVTFSQRFRIQSRYIGNVFGKASFGVFGSNRYGAVLDLMYPFRNERFSLEAELASLAVGEWRGFEYHYNDDFETFWSFGGNYYCPMLGTQFSLRAQKFLMGDYGLKFEMIRHFRYCSIGFYAEKGVHFANGWQGTKTNGGFRFQIALPPYRMKRYKSFPKVTTSGQMGLVYNANNEQYYYREFKVEASDNIMEHNGFNPYYIGKEIVKLNY